MALLSEAPALGAREREVVVSWERLAPLVEQREIEMELAEGVCLRGRILRLLPEGLELFVTETPEPALVPKTADEDST
jgi:hypothetical protein